MRIWRSLSALAALKVAAALAPANTSHPVPGTAACSYSRAVPFRSRCSACPAAPANGVPATGLPTQAAGWIDRASTTVPPAVVTTNSRCLAPPNWVVSAGPSGARSRKAATTPLPGTGVAATTTCCPVRVSVTGPVSTGPVSAAASHLAPG